jgi:hypothetical protein
VLEKLGVNSQKNELKFPPYTKISAKWVKELYLRLKPMKLEKNIGGNTFI